MVVAVICGFIFIGMFVVQPYRAMLPTYHLLGKVRVERWRAALTSATIMGATILFTCLEFWYEGGDRRHIPPLKMLIVSPYFLAALALLIVPSVLRLFLPASVKAGDAKKHMEMVVSKAEELLEMAHRDLMRKAITEFAQLYIFDRKDGPPRPIIVEWDYSLFPVQPASSPDEEFRRALNGFTSAALTDGTMRRIFWTVAAAVQRLYPDTAIETFPGKRALRMSSISLSDFEEKLLADAARTVIVHVSRWDGGIRVRMLPDMPLTFLESRDEETVRKRA